MVPNEVKVGHKFFTRISADATVQVEVVEDRACGTKRYMVRRCDTGAILRKLRGPGELHTSPGPWTRHATPAPSGVVVAKKKALVKPGLAKTMGPRTHSELLAVLAALPEDTRQFLGELIEAVRPSAMVREIGGARRART